MTAIDVDSARAQAFVQAATTAESAGNVLQAERIWLRLLSEFPQHTQALYHAGCLALRKGDYRSAAAQLRSGITLAPKEPIFRLTLAFALRGLGDLDGELAALDAALASDAYCYPALLAKGDALYRQGQKRLASRIFVDAIKITPPNAQFPLELQGILDRAKVAIQEDIDCADAFLSERLDALRLKHRGINLDRFERCVQALVGRQKVYVQQPTMLHYPDLPAIQFYDRNQFPWMSLLESGTQIVRQELVELLDSKRAAFNPYVERPAGVPTNQWGELNHSDRWGAFFLFRDAVKINENCDLCPKTAALLETLPLADMPNHAPTAFFSSLAPQTRIPAHTGTTNVRLIVHLPLIVPEGCKFRVGSEVRNWTEGEALVFDDTIEHEAFNDSQKQRVVLIFDIWNPYISQPERELISSLLVEFSSYYAG